MVGEGGGYVEEDIKSWIGRLDSLRKCLWNPEQCPHEGGCDYAAVDMCLDQVVSEMKDYLKPINLKIRQ